MKSKKMIITMASLLLNSLMGLSQTSGFYKNAADYRNQKLTYEADCSGKQKVKLHEFFNKPYITVVQGTDKYTVQKNEVYGFKDCNGAVYRFYNNKEYQILEPGHIFIYMTQESQSQGRDYKVVKNYFFSVAPDGAITELSVDNLKNAFPQNHKFHDLLDGGIKNADDLSAYDKFRKMYKVNDLYQTSLK